MPSPPAGGSDPDDVTPVPPDPVPVPEEAAAPASAPAYRVPPPPYAPPAPAPGPSPARAGGSAKNAQARASALDEAARHRLRGLVRDIRAQAQAILDATPDVRAALKLTDPAVRDAELEKTLKEFRRTAVNQITAIDDLRAKARRVLDETPTVYDEIGDAVTSLDTAWARASRALDLIRTADAADVHVLLGEVDEAIGMMMWQAAVVSMPSRVNEHLATLDVGAQLDFGAAFADELPTAQARRRFLEVLQSHPASVTGEVDVEHGVIYKAAQGPRRILSYVVLLLLIGPGAWLFIRFVTTGSSWLGVPANWLFATDRQNELWAAYIFVVGGVLFHLLVEAVKQAQRSTDKAFLALGHWMTWIHVRETSLGITILTMWIVPIGLALTLSEEISPVTAFFAGYSIDSIIGVFLTRFDGLAKSSEDAMLKRLRPAEPAPSTTAVTVPTT